MIRRDLVSCWYSGGTDCDLLDVLAMGTWPDVVQDCSPDGNAGSIGSRHVKARTESIRSETGPRVHTNGMGDVQEEIQHLCMVTVESLD